MNVFGDIERAVAELWPFRVPIGIAVVAGLAIFGVVAWRRGWLRAARARPRLTISMVGIVLIVALPIAWLLGSPLFIRTRVDEAPPVVAAQADSTLLSGEFQGADEFHFGRGKATLSESASGELVLSFEDFSVLNGPDLFVYVSPDPAGWTEDAVLLGGLKATDGSFSYAVPPGVDPADIASAVIWCRAFGVLFASATLEPATA